MAVVLRRLFMVVMCIGIALSAADAQGLICEYTCASGLGHSHSHEAEELNAVHSGFEHHGYSLSAALLLATGSPDSDADCSSINALVVATATTPDVPAPDHAIIGVIDAELYAMPSHRYRVTAVTGSPPLGADSSFPVTPVSLRI
jgi:hypothetical protein